MAKARYKANVLGAGKLSRRFMTEAARMDRDLNDMIENDFGPEAESTFAAFAPHRTGRLGRGIKVIGGGGSFIIRATAVDPASGYDYVGVTRLGHRVARIYPKRPRKALKLTKLGGIYRRSVRGFHPTGDWVDRALPHVNQIADKKMRLLGDGIVRRLRF